MKAKLLFVVALAITIINIGHAESNGDFLDGNNIDMQMEKYEALFREKFLQALVRNGYNDSYDFKQAHIDVSLYSSYSVPRVTGSLSYTGNIIYIPQGEQFESIWELTMKLFEGEIEYSERDRGSALRYWPSPHEGEVAEPIKKGPYPGIKYFKSEIDAIEQSLSKHQPILVIDKHFSHEINLGSGPDAVMNKSPTIYQLTDDVVQLSFIHDPSSHVHFGFKFHYSLSSGEISNILSISPPSLM